MDLSAKTFGVGMIPVSFPSSFLCSSGYTGGTILESRLEHQIILRFYQSKSSQTFLRFQRNGNSFKNFSKSCTFSHLFAFIKTVLKVHESADPLQF